MRAAHDPHQETSHMPKYLLLKRYRGGPEPHRPVPPIDQWAPEDVEAHMAFQHHVSELLEENGEYVDARALTPARTWVRYGGPDAAPVSSDGPHPETSDLVAGWWMIDVESHERAVELAAYVSSEPGGGPTPRRATRGRGYRRSRPGGSSTLGAARPPVTAARRQRTPSRGRAGSYSPRRATTPSSCSSAAATPTSRPPPRWR